MKLNKEQLQEIETYLTKKGVKYIDIRFEILDHISTDIENLMEIISFEEAFEKVKLKWKKNFVNRSSFWLGITNSGPSVFIDKCIRIYKPLWFKSLLLIAVFIAVFYSLNNILDYSLVGYENYVSLIISIGFVFYIGLIIFWYIRMKMKKENTTYSYLFYKQIMPNLFSALILNPYIHNSYITREHKFSFIMFTGLFIFFLIALGGKYFYKKHSEIVSNYKKYQLK